MSLENNTIRLLAQIVCQTRVSPRQQRRRAVIVPLVFSVITDDGKRSHPALLNGFRPHTHTPQKATKRMTQENNASLKCVKRNVEGRVSDRMSQKQTKKTNTGRKKDRVLPGTTFLIFIPCIGTPLGSAKAPRIWKGSRKKKQ